MASPHLEQLAQVEVFRGLREEALRRILDVARQENHEAGERLFRQGDAGDRLYIILSGKVRISRQHAAVGEETLAVLGPGQTFGEMALLDEAERSADAYAHEDCALLALAKDAFDDLLFANKELAYEVLWGFVQSLVGRLRETNDKLTFLSISGRF